MRYVAACMRLPPGGLSPVTFPLPLGSVLRFRNDTTGALVLVPLPRDTEPGATLHCNARGVVEGAGGGGGGTIALEREGSVPPGVGL